ncbi:MAG: hypothetical protein R3305_09505 [Gammaproteobacteria bacterium]|nr:hypothetical protein [Gammaproteobacteria bacterium]
MPAVNSRKPVELWASVPLLALSLAGCGPSTTAVASCDRACLIETANTYLAALEAGDPAAAPLDDDLGFVENLVRLPAGEGLWQSIAGISDGFRIVVPDPAAGSVGIIALIDRQTDSGIVPELLAVRLRLEDNVIVEAEHLIGELQPGVDASSLTAPRPNLTATVPEAERATRDELIAIADAYYEGLVASDASGVPFADDCERQENGLITAAWYLAPASFDSEDVNGNRPPPVARDCVGQMDSARFAYIDSIDHRRIFAADPVQGLVMGLSHFRQSMSRGPLEMIAADGTRVMWEEKRDPYDLPAAHVFKISGGQIHEIEAIGIFVPYLSATGWE